MRQELYLEQGSPEWHAHRATSDNASDAAAMLGLSQYKTRDDLLFERATGTKKEIDQRTQSMFDRGHRIEAIARPIAEQIIGDELFPKTVLLEIDGLRLSASFDGITMDDTIAWECKTINKELNDALATGRIPKQYHPQLEQQLLVSGADITLFMGADEDGRELHAWYSPNHDLRAHLIAGWKQFHSDLANYVAPEPKPLKAIAEPVKALPAINYTIDFSKGISISSNLKAFKVAAQMLVENSKTKLISDQDFENAKARVRQCEKAEENIKNLIDRVLGELGDVNTFKSDLESIGGWIKQSRLNQDKQIKERTAARRAEIVNGGKAAAGEYIARINAELKTVHMPPIAIDFEAAVYRKSSFESMQSSVNDALATFKSNANMVSEKIQANLDLMREIDSNHKFLFLDMQSLCVMDKEALRAIALRRIEDHDKAEAARIDALADAKIKAEAERLAAEKLANEKAAEAKQKADEKENIISENALSPRAHEIIFNQTRMNHARKVIESEHEKYMATPAVSQDVIENIGNEITDRINGNTVVNLVANHYAMSFSAAHAELVRLFSHEQ